MKSYILTLATAILAFIPGCVTDNVKFPAPSADFVAKHDYNLARNKLWEAALDALDKNHIAVVSADKSDGIIRTDYIAGPGDVMVPLGISQLTRYRYNVIVRSETSGKVKLDIFCTIEDSMSNSRTTGQWHDATSQNTTLESKLEGWLYEQIETELKTP